MLFYVTYIFNYNKWKNFLPLGYETFEIYVLWQINVFCLKKLYNLKYVLNIDFKYTIHNK